MRQYRVSSGVFEVCWDKEGGRLAACLSNKTVSHFEGRDGGGVGSNVQIFFFFHSMCPFVLSARFI